MKDPIGITGWPKEKGRDGERTPMQWTPGAQAGFSSNPHTWLPIAPDYRTVNVETESADPGSLLNWYKQLIALRRSNLALHNGGMIMLNRDDAEVLSYVRTAPAGGTAVVVAMNMSAQAKTVSLNTTEAGVRGTHVRTLAGSDLFLMNVNSLTSLALPPFSAWVGSVE